MKHELGAEDEEIQEIYGHATVRVTRKYTCIARDAAFNYIRNLKR